MQVQIPSRKNWLIVLFCLFTVVNLSAQDSYFPHHLGDMWEYYVVGDNLSEIMQVIVILDSVGQDSFSYFQHYRQYINPPRPTPISWWENFWQDTSGNVFGSGSGVSNGLIYKLNATLGELWIVNDLGGGYDIAKVEDIYADTLFGIPTTVKEIWYYSTEDTSGPIWLWQYTELLADGFGTVFRGGGDLAIYYEMFLKGAVINGIVYGDTTWVGIKQPSARILPRQFQLFQNFPNPFNPATTIAFHLPKSSHVEIEIYDISGRKVRTLINQTMGAGSRHVVWDGRDEWGAQVASGLYLYRILAGSFQDIRKMVLLR